MANLLYGVRSTIQVICLLVALYERHRENCVATFSGEIIAALDVLADGCATLRALNTPGPH